MHYFSFNIGDYARDTIHLDPLEDLAYRRILDLYYSRELPLPSDIDEISRLIRMRAHSESIAIVLKDFFTLEEDGYHQLRIDTEIHLYKEKSAKASKSAKARWKKAKVKQKVKPSCERIANAVDSHSEGNTKQEPLTNKQEPINKVRDLDQSQIDQEIYEFCFNQFWESGIRKVNKKKAKSLFINILKKNSNPNGPTPYDFSTKLQHDIQARIAIKQMGFCEMHPTTYLNGERWTDEIKEATHDAYQQPNQQRLSTVEQSLRETAAYGEEVRRRREERQQGRDNDQALGFINN